MRNKVIILTSGSGSLIDICLRYDFFRDSVYAIITDRKCGAIDIAEKHGVDTQIIEEPDAAEWSNKVLQYSVDNGVNFILSYSNLKILKGEILKVYQNRVFNSHFSLLPAFRGVRGKEQTGEALPATQIFERTLAFGSLVTGNTIHVVDEGIDTGTPVLVGILNLPYHADPKELRHKLFEIECKTMLQMMDWINQDRVQVTADGKVYIRDARFDQLGFSPNLEKKEIEMFQL